MVSAANAVVDRLEPRRMFHADVPAGFYKVADLQVPADGSPVAAFTFTLGRRYHLIASGTVSGGGTFFDAEYAFGIGNPQDMSGGVDVGVGLTTGGSTDNGLSWGGVFQADEVYGTSFTVTQAQSGAQLRWFGPNLGIAESLVVSVYEPLPTAPGLPAVPRAGGGMVRAASGADGAASMQDGVSASGVRYADGSVAVSSEDLRSDGFGLSFGQTRVWSNLDASGTVGGTQGNGWRVEQLSRLASLSGGSVVLINGDASIYFDLKPNSTTELEGRYFDVTSLRFDPAADLYVLTDGEGTRFEYAGFGSGNVAPGALRSVTDAAGNVTTAAYDVGGRLASITRASGTLTETWAYAYVSGGVNDGRLSSVTLSRTAASVTTTVRSVTYDYYDGVTHTALGLAGDLRGATIWQGGVAVERKHYRYYTSAWSSASPGFVGGLRAVVEGRAYARLAAAHGDPLTATDTQVRAHADRYFEYHPDRRVSKTLVRGAGGTATGGHGEFSYEYTLSSTNPEGFNSWRTQTVERVLDGTGSGAGVVGTTTVFSNGVGQTMLVSRQMGSSGPAWNYFYAYDGEGRLALTAEPSAVSGFDTDKSDLLGGPTTTGGQALLNGRVPRYSMLYDDAGLVTRFLYAGPNDEAPLWQDSNTAGGSHAGYLSAVIHQRGETGPEVTLREVTYVGVDVDPPGMQTPDGFADRILIASETYPDALGVTQVRRFGYGGFYPGTTQPSETLVVDDVIAGGGVTRKTRYAHDDFGRVVWTQDGDGYVHHTGYDLGTGAVIRTLTDATAAQVSSTGGVPSSWQLKAGNRLGLETTYRVDPLGRITRVVDPEGRTSYLTYDDVTKEVRAYRGWNSTAGTATGATVVVRDDWARGYLERLEMRAAPAHAGGEPTGLEAVSAVRSLTRDHFTAGGVLDRSDRYFRLAGTTYSQNDFGVSGSHFHRTTFAYNAYGQLTDLTRPTGTIERTAYDGLGRATATFVGTTTLNLTRVSRTEYDRGGVGDSLVTSVTNFPGGTSVNRVTQFAYDWRDRLVGRKDGAQASEATSTNRVITVYDLSDLGLVRSVSTFDGDGVALTTSGGALNTAAFGSPATRAEYRYDALGRVVAASNVWAGTALPAGVSSAALVTRTWYDGRDNVISVQPPAGPVMKYGHDGANRNTRVWATDGHLDQTDPLAQAGTVEAVGEAIYTADHVVEQTEYTYDGSGNVILTVHRKRFHDAPLASFGAEPEDWVGGDLSSPANLAWSRASYEARYYDAANRLVGVADHGTNGGAAFIRSASLPARSDTVLVTSFGHDLFDASVYGGTWFTTRTDPGGRTDRTYADLAGRSIRTHEAFVDGVPSDTDDRVTEYGYNGSDRVTSMSALLPGTVHAITAWALGPGNFGTIDLEDTDLIVRNRPLSDVRQWVANGLHDINPSQRRLVSSFAGSEGRHAHTTLAVRQNSENNVRLFASYGDRDLTTSDVIVKYTYKGDTNLDGSVDAVDINKVLNGWSNGLTGWENGDSNYDGVVDGTDYAAVVAAAAGQGAPFSGPATARQTTRFVYGVTSGTGEDASRVFSNELLREIRHARPGPDVSTWTPDGTSVERFAYDATGLRRASVDRRGVARVFEHDELGRMVSDRAGSFQGAIGSATFTPYPQGVNRLRYSYDAAGRLEQATSLLGTTVVNDVRRAYTGFGQLSTEWQEVFGAVDTATTPAVRYGFTAKPVDGGLSGGGPEPEPHGPLPHTLTYPDGRVIVYSYDNYLDQAMGRPTAIGEPLPAGDVSNRLGVLTPRPFAFVGGGYAENPVLATSQYLERYQYLGLSTVVERSRHDASVDAAGDVTHTLSHRLTYIQDAGTGTLPPGTLSAGDQYVGLDRFGRVVDQRWAGPTEDFDRYQYRYDRSSNPLAKLNILATDRSELYAYDALDRLASSVVGSVDFVGSLNAPVVAAPQRSRAWHLDAVGNWRSITTTTSSGTEVERRWHDAQNHVATHQLPGWGFTLPWILADGAGNVFENPVGQFNGEWASTSHGYDGWNRLSTTWSEIGGLTDYHYDALHRRIAETTLHSVEDENGVTSWTTSRVSYHSDRWQVLEEREAYNATISSSAKAQNVWSTVYVDALIARDDDADASAATAGRGLTADGTPSGGLERRVFALNDANFNVTALVGDAAGPGGSDVVVERYAYDPYGSHVILDADWTQSWVPTLGLGGAYGNPYRFQGLRADAATGVHHARFRDYDSGLGRWLTQDPLGWPDGANRYEFVRSNPLAWVDPYGLLAWKKPLIWVGRKVGKQLDEVVSSRVADKVLKEANRRANEEVRRKRLPRDAKVEKAPPQRLDHNRPIGRDQRQKEDLAELIQDLLDMGLDLVANDVRVNQQQVDAEGNRVGTNRPDLQVTIDGLRVHFEFENDPNGRGHDHAGRIIANDPNSVVIVLPYGKGGRR